MKRVCIIFWIVFIVLTGACNQTPMKETDKLPDKPLSVWPLGITYEIFVQSFYDSNGDRIGDFNGLTQKLDYLADLGVEAVWLMPIMPSPSYHKYDVTNYIEVHEDYGTLQEFKNFVEKAHERDIKVIIDLVINHTGIGHPWFVKARQKDPIYRDYYIWSDLDSVAEQINKKEVTGDSDNILQWHALDEDPEGEHYYGFFWGGMPDLNFDNPKVREEIYQIGKYWLSEIDVDGFRLDAAKHIYPEERATDNHNFWKEFRSEMQQVKEDVYLIGEVWAPTEVSAPFTQGLPALFNFDLAYSIIGSLKNERSVSAVIAGSSWELEEGVTLIEGLIRNEAAFRRQNPDFINATFLSNHDQNRIGSMLGGHQEKIKIAASILFTLPGSPYIYYGEEIGMLGQKPDPYIREPFLWDIKKEDSGRTTWQRPSYSTDTTLMPLQQQKKDDNSIYAHYKKLIALRRNSEILTLGDISEIVTESMGLLAYRRSYHNESLLVIHNLTDTAITYPVEGNSYEVIMSAPETIKLDKDGVVIPGYASIVVK